MERSLTLVALFAGIIAALGLIPRFEIAPGLGITAQSMGVMLCGTILGARLGGLAAGLFILVMLIGLPIWAGGAGGLGQLATAKVGFILGFAPAAFVTGWIMRKMTGGVWLSALVASVLGGMAVLYPFGIPFLTAGLRQSLGFATAALVIGWFMHKMFGAVWLSALVASVLGGMAVLYAFGIPGMAWGLGKTLGEATVIALAFIPGDLIKAVLVAFITTAVARARPGVLMSRA
jgi:biotin transport system substrate-specific component